MPLKTFRPTTPTQRYKSVADFAEITTDKPLKALTEMRREKGGRNNRGRTTMRYRGGGHKRRYRIIDFRRNKPGVPAKVATIEYDPNRSARIALLNYVDGDRRYVIAPLGVQVGDEIVASESADVRPGNAMTLRAVPLGTPVHSVELFPGRGAKVARAAGAQCQVVAKDGDYAQLRMPSGEIRKFHIKCHCVIGQVGNLDHENIVIGKAGRNRWLGRRPHVRGVAKNPVDHPMGGGEGKASGGRHPTTPWGKPTKGYRTRRNKSTNKWIVRRRGKK